MKNVSYNRSAMSCSEAQHDKEFWMFIVTMWGRLWEELHEASMMQYSLKMCSLLNNSGWWWCDALNRRTWLSWEKRATTFKQEWQTLHKAAGANCSLWRFLVNIQSRCLHTVSLTQVEATVSQMCGRHFLSCTTFFNPTLFTCVVTFRPTS